MDLKTFQTNKKIFLTKNACGVCYLHKKCTVVNGEYVTLDTKIKKKGERERKNMEIHLNAFESKQLWLQAKYLHETDKAYIHTHRDHFKCMLLWNLMCMVHLHLNE